MAVTHRNAPRHKPKPPKPPKPKATPKPKKKSSPFSGAVELMQHRRNVRRAFGHR